MFVIFLFGCLVLGKKDLAMKVRPGHVDRDYDSLEEVKGYENESTTEKAPEDEHLLREAILDVAYYLRRFKFAGHDPRYLSPGEKPKRNLFVEFPSPPLRNIHWEVKKNCEPSFGECVKYLQEQVSQTLLPRHLDSLTITKQNGWSFVKDRDLIKAADVECLKRLKRDEATFTVFPAPVRKFQWLTSASYYMCSYTMREAAPLRAFADDCDNLASCISWEAGLGNKDVRADNRQPFFCAFYSFCPDPCCPLRHLPEWAACLPASPCGRRTAGGKTCSLFRKDNVNFDQMTLNRWNVSCDCDQAGTTWDSKSGTCVDIDECADEESPCDYPAESCRNLPGSYKCVCSMMGYRSDSKTKTCLPEPVMHRVLYPPFVAPKNQSHSYLRRIQSVLQNFSSAVSRLFSGEETYVDINKTNALAEI